MGKTPLFRALGLFWVGLAIVSITDTGCQSTTPARKYPRSDTINQGPAAFNKPPASTTNSNSTIGPANALPPAPPMSGPPGGGLGSMSDTNKMPAALGAMPSSTVNTANRPATIASAGNSTPSGPIFPTGSGGFNQGTKVGPGGFPGNTGSGTTTTPLGAADSFGNPPMGGAALPAIPPAGGLQQTGASNEHAASPFQSSRTGSILPTPPAGPGHDPIGGGIATPPAIPGAPVSSPPWSSNPAAPGTGSGGNSTSSYPPIGVTTHQTAPPAGSSEIVPYTPPGSAGPHIAGDPLPALGQHP